MELVALFKCVVGLDIHQAQITACALIEQTDGSVRIEHRQFGAFKRDRRALAEWVAGLHPDEVVMESTGIYWKPVCGAGEGGRYCQGRQCPARQECPRAQDGCR